MQIENFTINTPQLHEYNYLEMPNIPNEVFLANELMNRIFWFSLIVMVVYIIYHFKPNKNLFLISYLSNVFILVTSLSYKINVINVLNFKSISLLFILMVVVCFSVIFLVQIFSEFLQSILPK